MEPDLDFIIIPGDNEWNECLFFDFENNSDPVKDLWREKFAAPDTPFWGFDRDFPLTLGDYPARPTLYRQDFTPENIAFYHNDVAFLGINKVSTMFVGEWAGQAEQNKLWITSQLAEQSCDLQSIVLFTQAEIDDLFLDEAFGPYFGRCGTKPFLNVRGDTHPDQFCMNRDDNGRFLLTVEAYKSPPLFVSIVQDPDGRHYFNVVSTSPDTVGTGCPTSFVDFTS